MEFLWFGVMFALAILMGTKIAIETPEEMHNKEAIFNLFRTINALIALFIVIFSNDVLMIILAFFFYVLSWMEEEILHEIFSKHKYIVFYKAFPLGNFFMIICAIMVYFYKIGSYNIFYTLGILLLINALFIAILESYYEIKRKYPSKRFTTETRLSKKFTLNLYFKEFLRYLPIVVILLAFNFIF